MKILIAGATGALGQPLVRQAIARGHEVMGVARSDPNEALLQGLGATPARASLFDAAALARAARGCDVVVRVATHIAPTPTSETWAMNDRIRREGTQALLDAAKANGARYLQESIVWVARPDDGAPFDEQSPTVRDDVVGSAIDAERLATESGVPSATLRLGWLYGRDNAQQQMFAQMLRKRRLPILGSGDSRMSFLHLDDAARAFLDAAERGVVGAFHVVDDQPTTVAEYLRALADVAGAPAPLRVPTWVGRLAAGAFVAKFLTTPMVTTHDKLTRATGWTPTHRSVLDGLRAERPPALAA